MADKPTADVADTTPQKKKKGFPKKRTLPAGVHQVAHRFALRPTDDQKVMLAKTFGCTRFIWNQMLNDSILHYQTTGKHTIPTPAGYKSSYDWLKEVDSLALANAQLNLRKAFSAFFDKDNPAGFPNFKKKNARQSYTTNNQNGTIRLLGQGKRRQVKLPKIGYVEVIVHREIQGVIRSATVTKEPSGDYFISILCEHEIEKPVGTHSVVGIDLGLTDLTILSDGTKIENPKYLAKTQKKINRELRKLGKQRDRIKRQDKNKRLSDCKNYQKQRAKVAKLYQKLQNQRKDFVHKLTSMIIQNHDVIMMENLAVKNMMKNHKLAKAIGDVAWGTIKNLLLYKANWYGKQVVIIDRFFASSKTCHCCGFKAASMPLSVRTWDCPECNTHHDRDINAAINIKNEGIRQLTA